MVLYPALDIVGGELVRLRQGRFDALTRYSSDPVSQAKAFLGEGAVWLHVVDLDGARTGRPANLGVIEAIAQATEAKLQVGGGIRDKRSLADLFAAGATRAVLGTAALTDQPFLRAALDRYGPQRIAVSVDARGGKALAQGWLARTEQEATAVLRELVEVGVRTLIFTDVDRDGTLSGPALAALEEAVGAAEGAELIASGGVGSLADLRALACLPAPPAGVIVGKALYERRFTVAAALEALAKQGASGAL
jgi:phosphoribosylformimino-5-aminoimidazole carboxamide ribotide isomerase